MTDDNDVYTPAQYREHQDGYGVRDPDAHPHAGIVRDPKVSRYLSILAENYDPSAVGEEMPGEADGLKEVRSIRRIAGTETARSALDGGDMPTLKHMTGDQNQRADISGMKAIQQIDEIIENPAPVIVILGEMGTGKTDFACLIAQRAKHLLGVEKVASNVPTLKETNEWEDADGDRRSGFVSSFNEMDEWVRQDGDPLEEKQARKLFLGDEFSSVGDGGGKSGYLMRKKMGPLVFKIRKFNGLLIYIAHDESSIHPLLWRVGVIVKKVGKKQAIIADKIKGAELKGIQGRIDGIPQTDWRYNTKDPAVWSWTDSEDEGEPEPGEIAYDVAVWTVRACKQDGLTHRQTAEYVPFGKSWVGNRWDEIQSGEHQDAVDRVEALTA